jgi:hypothetical protein
MVIFDNYIDHSTMAEMLGAKREDLVSAGFIKSSTEGVRCYGESISLGVRSRPQDTEMACRKLGFIAE